MDRRTFVKAASGAAAFLVPAAARAVDRPFVLEEFFVGRTIGKGSFSIPIAGIRRNLTVRTRGRWDGRTLTLVEDFLFADGERDRKTWRFAKLSPDRYEGVREDVVGKADIRQVGQVVGLWYTADVRAADGSTTRLGFADTIGYSSSGGVYNIATVTRLGLPIGDVKLMFYRAE
jgi:hypothetical protein